MAVLPRKADASASHAESESASTSEVIGCNMEVRSEVVHLSVVTVAASYQPA